MTMTKSIEEQGNQYRNNLVQSELFLIQDGLFPDERVRVSTFHDISRRFNKMYQEGAKARDEQWLKVMNELREALNCISVDICFPSNVLAKQAIIKADQMLKEMGIK